MDFTGQKELVKLFIDDASEFILQLENILLQLEESLGQEVDSSLITELLGILHTFKGNAGMMGFSPLQNFAHTMEDVLKGIEAKEIYLDEDVVAQFLSGSTSLSQCITILADAPNTAIDLDYEIEALQQLLQHKKTTKQQTEALKDKTNIDESSTDHATLDPKTLESINKFGAKSTLLRVDFERLDHLLNLVGELVIHRTRLNQIDSQIKEYMNEQGLSIELTNTSEQIAKVSTELHEAIMKVRMLPLRHVFMRFSRLVRDLAKAHNKNIHLYFEGENTELDKTVIDEIGEPLLHLVRNAVDHGIESPQERTMSGKSNTGIINIRAYQQSNEIIIVVEDDGKGINPDIILQKAKEKELIKSDDIDNKTILDLIFLPGFSTAKKVTDISGRGVGMDVVRKSLSRINGSIEVKSEVGIGTQFIIKLPLTLAIVSALLVEVSSEQYAIPLASVIESIKVDKNEIHMVNNNEVITIRDKVIPIMRLAPFFGLEGQTPHDNLLYTVIVQSTQGEMGIIVDRLVGQQEIVIKALDESVSNAVGIAGATILGDGQIVLILDIHSLMSVRTRVDGSIGYTIHNGLTI